MSERLHVRQSGVIAPDGAYEVVYADEWDDLCEVAAGMADALRPFASVRDHFCMCPNDDRWSCRWCEATHALKAYEDAER